ncbi:MAG: ATP-binding protein [Deltaproteobacteria bacterium]|jgi:hypothetical protein|nr:ATP-binding protein [Deltaproteobacteria bacterium]
MRAILVPADSSRLGEMLSFLSEGFPEDFIGLGPRVERAMRELVGLVHDVSYGGKSGNVQVSRKFVTFNGEACLIVTVCDWGAPYDPFDDPGHGEFGGPGARLADYLSYHYNQNSNVNEMYFLAPEAGG